MTLAPCSDPLLERAIVHTMAYEAEIHSKRLEFTVAGLVVKEQLGEA